MKGEGDENIDDGSPTWLCNHVGIGLLHERNRQIGNISALANCISFDRD
jgi:hypothetical protein